MKINGKNLLFTNYFFYRFCKLANCTLVESFDKILGKYNEELDTMQGGILDDLQVRAMAVTAGVDAYESNQQGISVTNELFLGWEIVNSFSLFDNQIWIELFTNVSESINAQLPESAEKKKVVKKK